MTSWKDERPPHGIVLLNAKGNILLCACGEEILLAGSDQDMTQDNKNNALLDRHELHRERQERKKKNK